MFNSERDGRRLGLWQVNRCASVAARVGPLNVLYCQPTIVLHSVMWQTLQSIHVLFKYNIHIITKNLS